MFSFIKYFHLIMLKLFILFVAASAFSAPTDDELVITLPDGQIQGAAYQTPNNVTYYGWRGIPFATPPLGHLRFEAPQPPQPWTGVLSATQDGPVCLNALDIGNSSEDCLTINVYIPSLKSEKLPVMFWIYGGAFQGGDSTKELYGPDFLIEEDVIVVTSNYRVGPFGFLSTGDAAMRGNVGLKDQLLALKWTKNNIALFGGDPEKITIFGESAGGQSVGLHLVSPRSAGLFRAAIVESGSAMTNSSATVNPQKYTFELANLIPGANFGNDTRKLTAFLKNCTADEILTASRSITGQDIFPWPVIELEDDDAFLTESPYVLYESGRFNQVPAIMGICSEEGLESGKSSAEEHAALLDRDPKKLIPFDLRPNTSDEDAVAARVRSFYLQEDTTFSSNLSAAVKFQSDQKFVTALLKNAELHSKYAPVYVYQFAYSTEPADIDGVYSAQHGSEIPFIFFSTRTPPKPHLPYLGNDTDVVRQRIVKMWANFAKYSNPTPEKIDLLQNLLWPMITPQNIQYINMNASLEVGQDFRGNMYRQWNDTYYTYGAKPFITF